jgi:1-aminocyclopropane-1-carboxylate deaminase/D-cysteine desulfhydrase-like pyridoxal-dependent ACC family enzyme
MTQPPPAPCEPAPALRFGRYPTPLRQLSGPEHMPHDIWVKDDGHTAPAYGGNKVRKLERLLAVAMERGSSRLLTIGAAGSHHVLATTLYGRQLGLPTQAVLTPQPWSAHAQATLRAGVNAGLSAVPAASYADAILQLRRQRRAGDFVIGPGGWGAEGTWAYSLAVEELSEQLAAQGISQLDAIVVAAGSGSTAAGLLAGMLRTGIAPLLVAVRVAPNPGLRTMIVGQAMYASWRHHQPIRPVTALRSLCLDGRFVGNGYGHPCAAGDEASELARSFGLELEPTYTAKAFAATLSWARRTEQRQDRCKLRLHRRRTYLYWHTLSSAPMAALLEGAPETLPDELARLFSPIRSAQPLVRVSAGSGSAARLGGARWLGSQPFTITQPLREPYLV